MAFSKIEKEGLFVELEKVKAVEEKEVNVWYKELHDILNSKTIKFFKFLAGKKVNRILEIANKLVELISFIQALGGWQNFKILLLKLIEMGGIDETIKKLEKK